MDNHLNPEVSVVMAVYNGEKFLEETMHSMLAQTFSDFEFIIIDDGSTDQTEAIVKSFNDKRINYVANAENMGTVKSLNRGLAMAKGNFIARMDADDISHPTRIEKQVYFLKNNSEIAIVGCHINLIDENNNNIGTHIYPTKPSEIKAMMPFESPLGGPCVMFRTNEFRVHNLYYVQEYLYAEDYDLWQRALTELNGANYDEILLNYRISSIQVSNRHYHQQQIADHKIKSNALQAFQLDEETLKYLDLFLQDNLELRQATHFKQILNSLENWFKENEKLKIYDNDLVKKLAALKLEKILTFYTSKTHKLFKHYQKSELYSYNSLSFLHKLKSYVKQLANG